MKTILVPSDLSANSATALRYAIRLGLQFKARLVVLHCIPVLNYRLTPIISKKQLELLLKEEREKAGKKLGEQVARTYRYLGFKKIPPGTMILVEASPTVVDHCIKTANHSGAHLIVMGTHGAGGLKKYIFGSTASNMISRSAIPVLAIPGGHRFKKAETILFASDLENIGDELSRLIPFAKDIKAGIDILHMYYATDPVGMNIPKAESIIKESSFKKLRLVKCKVSPEYPIQIHLHEYLDKHKPALLVMFSKKRSFWNKLFSGSKTEELTNESLGVPLLSFRKSV